MLGWAFIKTTINMERKNTMDRLTRLIYEDMKPALGVTEPGAIAFAVATAKAHIQGKVDRVDLRLNSGMS